MADNLFSMTGYASASANMHDNEITISMSSVNSKGLDIRLRIASGFEIIEKDIRQIMNDALSRGSVAVSLSVKSHGGTSQLVVNEKTLDDVVRALKIIKTKMAIEDIPTSRLQLDNILTVRNILEQKDIALDEKTQNEICASIIATTKLCLNDLLLSRQAEGARLKQIVLQRIKEIEVLTKKADIIQSNNKQEILQKLSQQISELTKDNVSLSEERLNQEALILATKADIREELDRLYAHVYAAKSLINDGGVIGRKLDFLAQEFNREANTLCAKSNSVDLTAIGMDIKVSIDQLREQVQNIQ